MSPLAPRRLELPADEQFLAGFEELMHRVGHGLSVSLLWNRYDERVKVVVVDSLDGSSFELDVAGDPPLDVFAHPYAYAAARGDHDVHGDAPPAEPVRAAQMYPRVI